MSLEYKVLRLNRSIKEYDQLVLIARILTILTEVGLRFLSLKTTERIFAYFTKSVTPPDDKETIVIIDKYSTLFKQMNDASSLKGRCLSRSLVMRFLLSRKGISPDLKIGISQITEHLDVHAWLELDGVLINDDPSVISNYTVLPFTKPTSIFKIK